MGSGGSKAHEAFTVAPATAVMEPPPDYVPSGGQLPPDLVEVLEDFNVVAGLGAGDMDYPSFVVATTSLLDTAADLPDQAAAADLVAQVKEITTAALTALPPVQLQQIGRCQVDVAGLFGRV